MLRQIDGLELAEADPQRLAALFEIDQLATRMRRTTDSSLVLAGDQAPPRWTEPVTLLDLLRAAVSEIEQYDRVVLDVDPAISPPRVPTLAGPAAVDVAHLLAELLENATTFSPATTQVTMSGSSTRGGGWLVRITDRGQGVPEAQLRQLNELLARPPLADAAGGPAPGFVRGRAPGRAARYPGRDHAAARRRDYASRCTFRPR